MDLQNLLETKCFLENFEKEIAQLFRDEKVKGPVHFSDGNEEQIIKIFRGLRREDYVFHKDTSSYSRQKLIDKKLIIVPSTLAVTAPLYRGIQNEDWIFTSYRNHYHALLKGVPAEWLKDQIVKGNSMHPLNKEYKLVTSAIVNGQLPIAIGVAEGIKKENSQEHVWAFCGDMGAEMGVFHEVTKYAHNHDLPITFVIEDNGLSVDTPTEKVWGCLDYGLRENTIRYPYKSKFPHQGIGKEVGF